MISDKSLIDAQPAATLLSFHSKNEASSGGKANDFVIVIGGFLRVRGTYDPTRHNTRVQTTFSVPSDSSEVVVLAQISHDELDTPVTQTLHNSDVKGSITQNVTAEGIFLEAHLTTPKKEFVFSYHRIIPYTAQGDTEAIKRFFKMLTCSGVDVVEYVNDEGTSEFILQISSLSTEISGSFTDPGIVYATISVCLDGDEVISDLCVNSTETPQEEVGGGYITLGVPDDGIYYGSTVPGYEFTYQIVLPYDYPYTD